MMKMTCVGLAAAAVAASSLFTAAPAFAEASKEAKEAVQGRRGYYRMLALNTGPLVGMATGKAPYDAAQAGVFATNLDLLAKIDVGHLYPEGTDNEAMWGETRALPKIWADFDGARKKDDAFEAAAAALAAAAPQSLQALQGAIGAVGDACKACHEEYRAKEF